MTNIKYTLLLLVVVVGSFLLNESIFLIDQKETGIKLRLGQVVSSDYQPGLHFKYPFVEKIIIFDQRIQVLNGTPQSFLTKEKKRVIVDSYTTWLIEDPVTFYTSTRGNIGQANRRLSQIIQDGLRSAFGSRDIQQLINKDREEVMFSIRDAAKNALIRFGISVVDFRINRIELSDGVRNSIYQRMAAERQRVAKDFRSRGAEEAEKIQASADRQRVEILADAYRQSEILRGEGDSTSYKIYSKAYEQDLEFYRFQRSLSSYKESFNSKNSKSILLLNGEQSYFNFMNSVPSGSK